MSDEQLKELMESVETDKEVHFSSDDDLDDPDYIVDDKDDQCISRCVREMIDAESSDIFLEGINTSLNISSIDNRPSTSALALVVMGTSTSTPVVSTVRTSIVKPQKRARSPLPSVEDSGPSVVPSAGGFTGTGGN